MTDPLRELLRIAEKKTECVLWNGPDEKGPALLDAIRALRGAAYGGDWTDCIPDELADCWGSLGDEAKLAAFIVAASHSFSLGSGGL
jgi:hypothetical protein